jgi:RNA polymerase sigma factor (sigma-70 family)
MKQTNDHHFVDLVLMGDKEAFAPLVERHKEMIFSIAIKILRNTEEAEEVAQDAFVKAYASLGSFKRTAKFSTWLYRIAYNEAISRKRKKKMEHLSMNEHLIENYSEDAVQESVNALDEEEQKAMIDKALAALPEEEASLIQLYYFNNQSVDEISQITGLSPSNTKVRLHRIRKKLYGMLSEMMLVQSA